VPTAKVLADRQRLATRRCILSKGKFLLLVRFGGGASGFRFQCACELRTECAILVVLKKRLRQGQQRPLRSGGGLLPIAYRFWGLCHSDRSARYTNAVAPPSANTALKSSAAVDVHLERSGLGTRPSSSGLAVSPHLPSTEHAFGRATRACARDREVRTTPATYEAVCFFA